MVLIVQAKLKIYGNIKIVINIIKNELSVQTFAFLRFSI